MVYNTTTATNTGLQGRGYYFWNGTAWEKFLGATDQTAADATRLVDTDGDTLVQVEESADDDTIRLDAKSVEVATFTATQTHLNTAITEQHPGVSGNPYFYWRPSSPRIHDPGNDHSRRRFAWTAKAMPVQKDKYSGTQTYWRDTIIDAPILTASGQLDDIKGTLLEWVNNVYVQGDYAYVTSYLVNNGTFYVVNISDPDNPVGVSSGCRTMGRWHCEGLLMFLFKGIMLMW